jgi:hypothetical protein
VDSIADEALAEAKLRNVLRGQLKPLDATLTVLPSGAVVVRVDGITRTFSGGSNDVATFLRRLRSRP